MAAGKEEYSFCENYMVIKPEQASFSDLLRILLCSSELEKRDFLNTPVQGGGLTRFRHRWIVFISVLLQKVLLCLKTPLAAAGSAVELFLNLPAANGGYHRLFFNLLTGRVVRPDKSSATFRSIAANVDKRFDRIIRFNSNTTKESREYYYYASSMAMMASKLTYEHKSFVRNVVTNNWQMEFMEFYSFWNDYEEQDTTQAIMFRDRNVDPNLIVVAFRGTEPFNADDWRTDVDISWFEFNGIGKIHGGFMKALGLQKSTGWPKEISPGPDRKSYAYYTIRETLRALFRLEENENPTRFLLTGHSLGGALAILFAGLLAVHEEELLLDRLEGVYTFGQPRVGNEQFGEYMKWKMRDYDVKYFRFVYSNDIVPRLPYDDDDNIFLFKHFGPCLYFNSCYEGQVLEEEPNKNYFSFLSIIPKILTAVYQLIRSFILPWTKGEEYKEGWLMRLFRVTALGFPGFTDHILVDYVNLTRLGKLFIPGDQTKISDKTRQIDTVIYS